jgi:tol-pal system protein YbgF
MSPNKLPLLLALLSGCAWITQNGAASAEYSRQVSTASMRVADLEADLETAEARIQQLEEAVRVQGQTQASRLENLDQVNAEIGRLRGQIEEMKFQVGEMQRFLDESAISRERRTLHIEKRVSQLEKFLGVTPPPPPTDAEMGIARSGDPGTPPSTVDPATDPTVQTPHEPPPPATAAEKLKVAKDNLAAGRPAVARAVLEKAVGEHPGDPVLPEIRYRIGEAWLAEKQYKKAAKAFQHVVDNHPQSEWVPWAVLRQGECFDGLGQPDNAKVFYQTVVKDHPKSDAAKEAKAKLGK